MSVKASKAHAVTSIYFSGRSYIKIESGLLALLSVRLWP